MTLRAASVRTASWLRARLIFGLILLAMLGFGTSIAALLAVHGQDHRDLGRLRALLCDQQDGFRSLPTKYDRPQSKAGGQLVTSVLKIQSTGQVIYVRLRCGVTR